MDKARTTFQRDLRCIAAAAIAALIALEVEAASRATFDAVQTSTAIAYRVVASPTQARASAGVSLSLTVAAVCLILLARISGDRAKPVDGRHCAITTNHFDASVDWRNRLIRAARLGGALDR
ncbi:MAG: hypothetical protein H6818_21145 [Phycisphaerales bacterium]|nr:hypothetical protein [Phycisphaerales bacterium]MCB9862299.1 hypothetical protein [Phycisphaerales bacterium]